MPINLRITQPKTLEGAVDFIVNQMSDDEKKFVLTHGATQLHMTVGMALRNEWNLWGTQEDKPKWLHDHFVKRFGLGIADDMSCLILEGVEARVQGRDPRYDDSVMKFRRFWKDQNRSPLDGSKLSQRTFVEKVKAFLRGG